jgi:dynactin 1
MIKRLEDLAQDSSAVKPHVIPQMEALNNFMAELVNFGISVRYLHIPVSICKFHYSWYSLRKML